MTLLEVTREPLVFVDSTPNEGYVLRILAAHRENCNCKWVSTEPNPTVDVMNAACDKRAVLLDKAIALLEKA